VYGGHGVVGVEFILVCREAAGKDLRAGRRQVADAGEKSAIENNVHRALVMADKSAYNYYRDFAEQGFYNRIIAGNINQTVRVDSVVCDFDSYPYQVKTFARQTIIRESNVTERTLVTECRLMNSSRSDDNPNGFQIRNFTIIENKDIRTVKK